MAGSGHVEAWVLARSQQARVYLQVKGRLAGGKIKLLWRR